MRFAALSLFLTILKNEKNENGGNFIFIWENQWKIEESKALARIIMAIAHIYILEIKARQRRANKKQVFYVCGKSDKGKGGISVILCQM